MEQENQRVNVAIGQYDGKHPIEIILREGKAAEAVQPLETKAPEKISVIGVIETPLEWLKKRIDTIDQKLANIQVDREAMSITLTINENDYYKKNQIMGVVQLSEVYTKFGINDPQIGWEPAKLGQFLRINRALFQDKETCAILVSLLKNFKAKAKAEIQKQRDPSGSVADVYRTEVESNLPKSFTVNIPIFKGKAKAAIEVEFDHYIRDNEVYLQLVSPGANECVESFRDNVIDSILAEISTIAPDIVVMEL